MPFDHYISQVHLKNFNSPALDGLIYAIRKSDLKRFRTKSQDVCRIEDGSTNAFLQESRAIEEFLKDVEPRYNASLEQFPFSVNRGIHKEPRIRFCGLLGLRRLAMGYSNDLRIRVIQVVEGGAAARAAARQFVIGDATAIRWAKRWRETGSFEAKSNKGQSRSPLKKHEEWLLELVRQEPDLTLEEIQRRLLDERQQKAGIGSVWRFFDRHGVSFKKKRSGGRAGSA